MQTTPMKEDESWRIDFPQDKVFKNKAMGWIFTEGRDYNSGRNFERLEHCVRWCRENGFDFDVVYPKYRRFEFKSYAENFKWKGEAEVQEDSDYV